MRGRKNSRVVMMSLDDFNSIQEISYLLRSPANAERLRQSIKQYDEGKVISRRLIVSDSKKEKKKNK